MSTIEERVKKIIGEQLGVKQEEVTNNASFVEDLVHLLLQDSLKNKKLFWRYQKAHRMSVLCPSIEAVT